MDTYRRERTKDLIAEREPDGKPLAAEFQAMLERVVELGQGWSAHAQETNKLVSLVACARPPHPVILEPPGDGSSIDIEDMVAACRGFAETWPGCYFAFDSQAGGQQLLQRLEREIPESTHILFPQDPRRLCDASMGFAELVSARQLRHPDHPQLNDHVLAAAARFVGERWRFVRPRGKHRWIDGLTAASIATSLVGTVEEVTPIRLDDRAGG